MVHFGEDMPTEEIINCVSHGIVFVDEIDKIRSHVGGQPNVNGIIAQESLLTLMESETQGVGIPVKDASGNWSSMTTPIDTRGILFIAAGAFEELYDQVFDRCTQGGKNPPWRLVSKADGSIERQIVFQLGDNLIHSDLFKYGMTPQFCARFDSIVTLRNLGAKDLVTIFRDIPDALLPVSQEYFEQYGVRLNVTEEALFFIADRAVDNQRLGARALKEVFSKIVGGFEYDPWAAGKVTKGADGDELLVDLETAKAPFGD
jgi:ATP-dependent Clp protease ATP-binding subunit ClpX